jgi:hypothetical protein
MVTWLRNAQNSIAFQLVDFPYETTVSRNAAGERIPLLVGPVAEAFWSVSHRQCIDLGLNLLMISSE